MKRIIGSWTLFTLPTPHEQEREALRSEIDNLKKELSAKDSREDNEEKRQLALMEKSYQMAAKYLPKASTPPTFNNGLTAGKGEVGRGSRWLWSR